MMKRIVSASIIPVLLCIMFFGAVCQGIGADLKTERILPQYQGKILLLLMGMPGCSGTERATEFLSRYAGKKPGNVEILRLDVPPPEGNLSECAWNMPFPREIDGNRTVADHLEFFFYPTFYIMDREGSIRFCGECRPGEVEKMVDAIDSEKPGSQKHFFTPPLPEAGTEMKDFSGITADNNRVSLSALRRGKPVLLFFGSTACPFSMNATGALPEIAGEFKSCPLTIVIVNAGPLDEGGRLLYAEKAPGIPVIADKDRAISGKQFAVPAVPFFYLLDAQGRILQRKPFTSAAAKSALSSLTGIKPAEEGTKKPGAG